MAGSSEDRVEKQDRVARVRRGLGADARPYGSR